MAAKFQTLELHLRQFKRLNHAIHQNLGCRSNHVMLRVNTPLRCRRRCQREQIKIGLNQRKGELNPIGWIQHKGSGLIQAQAGGQLHRTMKGHLRRYHHGRTIGRNLLFRAEVLNETRHCCRAGRHPAFEGLRRQINPAEMTQRHTLFADHGLSKKQGIRTELDQQHALGNMTPKSEQRLPQLTDIKPEKSRTNEGCGSHDLSRTDVAGRTVALWEAWWQSAVPARPGVGRSRVGPHLHHPAVMTCPIPALSSTRGTTCSRGGE